MTDMLGFGFKKLFIISFLGLKKTMESTSIPWKWI